METQYTRLSMTPSGVPPVIYMSQNDIGRPIGFICDADLSDYSVVLEGTRTDGTPITVAVTVDGNICAFETTATMTNKADVYIVQIVVTNASGKHISSIPIKCVVVLAAMDENSEGIEEDAPLYQQYTGTVQSLIADIRTQLNTEAAARQAADNTLQSNINSEASTRAATDQNLQAQISQIVAPSGEAPSAAEVQNARVGADGVTYSTLGEAIRANDSQLKSALVEIASVKLSLKLTSDYSVTTGYTVGETSPLTVKSDPGWQYLIYNCSAGDKFEISVFGGVSNHGYVFVDQNNKILSASIYGSINETVTAPNGAVKIAVNDHGTNGYVKLITPPGKLDALETDVNVLKDGQDLLNSAVALVSNDEQCNQFFKELYLEGADPSVTYKWYVAARNHSTYKYNVGIAIDGTTTIVAYLMGATTEPANPVTIPEYNNSGITGYAVLDWTALEYGSNKAYNVPLNDSVKNVFNSPSIYSYLNQMRGEDILIAMPERINAVVGDTLQLYYQGMFRCVNSYNYAVTLQCDVGAQYPRYYELTPTAANIGEHTLTVQLRDNNGNIMSSKNVIINVVAEPSSPSSMKNIFCVGASCTQNGEWVGEFQRKLTEDYDLSNFRFIGRMSVNGTKLEASGGYTWNSYTNASSALLYKFYFNAANLPSVVNIGDVYASNGHNYTIAEINIPTPDGGGYISCTSDGLPGGASGTLTRVSGEGDATLTYYNYVTGGNPFVYNGAINLPQYMTEYCNGVSPDVVYTELFVNGTGAYNSDITPVMDAMKAFAQMFHAAYPNCKIALGMPYCPDEKGGTGKNYNASGNFSWAYGIKWTFMEYMKVIEDYLEDNGLASYVTLVDWTNEFDSENDFLQTTKAVNVRSTQTEVFGVNGIHPSNVGYMQMADSAVRHFIANFCQ